jgi:hypothetical protein
MPVLPDLLSAARPRTEALEGVGATGPVPPVRLVWLLLPLGFCPETPIPVPLDLITESGKGPGLLTWMILRLETKPLPGVFLGVLIALRGSPYRLQRSNRRPAGTLATATDSSAFISVWLPSLRAGCCSSLRRCLLLQEVCRPL